MTSYTSIQCTSVVVIPYVYSVSVQHRIQDARFSLGLFQKPLCLLGALMCPLHLAQRNNVPFGSGTKKQCALWLHLKTNIYFNSHLNYLNLTVWPLNIELSEHWTELKMLCWQWYTGNKCLVQTVSTFKMRGVVIRYYLRPLACKFWWEHWQDVLIRGSSSAVTTQKWVQACFNCFVYKTLVCVLTSLVPRLLCPN